MFQIMCTGGLDTDALLRKRVKLRQAQRQDREADGDESLTPYSS